MFLLPQKEWNTAHYGAQTRENIIEDLSLALMPLCVPVYLCASLLVPVSIWMKLNTIAGVMLAYDQAVGEEIEMSLF